MARALGAHFIGLTPHLWRPEEGGAPHSLLRVLKRVRGRHGDVFPGHRVTGMAPILQSYYKRTYLKLEF